MAEQFQNFFVTKLREACDATATTIYVETVPSITEGTLVLEYANSTKHEIIHFTGVSGYGLTGCTRGLEGTTAQSHSAGTDVRQNLTAGMIDKLINGVITTENIADGAVTADKIDFTTLTVLSAFLRQKTTYGTTESTVVSVTVPTAGKWFAIATGCWRESDNDRFFRPRLYMGSNLVYSEALTSKDGDDRTQVAMTYTADLQANDTIAVKTLAQTGSVKCNSVALVVFRIG